MSVLSAITKPTSLTQGTGAGGCTGVGRLRHRWNIQGLPYGMFRLDSGVAFDLDDSPAGSRRMN